MQWASEKYIVVDQMIRVMIFNKKTKNFLTLHIEDSYKFVKVVE